MHTLTLKVIHLNMQKVFQRFLISRIYEFMIQCPIFLSFLMMNVTACHYDGVREFAASLYATCVTLAMCYMRRGPRGSHCD